MGCTVVNVQICKNGVTGQIKFGNHCNIIPNPNKWQYPVFKIWLSHNYIYISLCLYRSKILPEFSSAVQWWSRPALSGIPGKRDVDVFKNGHLPWSHEVNESLCPEKNYFNKKRGRKSIMIQSHIHLPAQRLFVWTPMSAVFKQPWDNQFSRPIQAKQRNDNNRVFLYWQNKCK